ncbi:MAG: helix-turn-helix transcriptional regulator [Polyangiaceae bacterium]
MLREPSAQPSRPLAHAAPGEPAASDRIADAAYHFDVDDAAWVQSVLDACAAVLDEGARNGLAAVFIDCRGVALSATRAAPGDARCLRVCDWLQQAPVRGHLGALGGAGVVEGIATAGALFLPAGVAQVLYAAAGERQGPALLLVSPRGDARPSSAKQAALWSRAAACITAGLHLRQHLAGGAPRDADEAAPSSRRLRASLRCALQVSEQGGSIAGPLDRRSPEQARSLWSAVVAGQWALIDRFDADGKRYLVARRSASAAAARSPLSAREYQIACMVAAGQSNKAISYELGLAASTVATHLSSAMQKLGVPSRVELVQLFGPG